VTAVGLVVGDAELAETVTGALERASANVIQLVPDADDAQRADGVEAIVVAGPLDRNAESLLARARTAFAGTPLLACARAADPGLIRWTLENRADGVILEDDVATGLEPALAAVRAGLLVAPRALQARPRELTTREKQVLSLVVMGLTNGEIAQRLYVTEATVKSHLGTAFRKLGVASRTEAARLITDPAAGLGMGILAITPERLTTR
jgi:DNA-binding NarL/FixJ family response regulator